jgi:hypothetical protein
MSKRAEIEKFGLHNYDDSLCLRPSWLLIAGLVFLCRGLIAYLLVGVAKGVVPAGLIDVVGTETLSSGCLAAAPAVLVLYAFAARVPNAPAIVRWIWRHGRALMALSAGCYIALALPQLGSDPHRWLTHGSLAVKVLVLAEVALVAYLFLSPRVRQAFLDFPSA